MPILKVAQGNIAAGGTTVSITPSGLNRALVVIVFGGNTTAFPTSVTFGGVALTKVAEGTNKTQTWILKNPNAQAANVVLGSADANISACAIALTGVNLSAFPNATYSAASVGDTIPFSPTVPGDWIVGGVGLQYADGSSAVAPGVTLYSFTRGASGYQIVTGTSATLSFVNDGSDLTAGILIRAISPSGDDMSDSEEAMG